MLHRLAALLLVAATAAAPVKAQPAPVSWFVPPSFTAPTLVEGRSFKLVPLGPELADIDRAAYMSSVEHLQKTFTRSTRWPHPGITHDDAVKDMLGEQERFRTGKSFAYAVLTPDGLHERGCVYLSPSPVPGHDAVVRMWVTKAEYDAGFDAELYAWVTKWVRSAWPFASVAYPGRSIGWASWDAMVAAASPRPATAGS